MVYVVRPFRFAGWIKVLCPASEDVGSKGDSDPGGAGRKDQPQSLGSWRMLARPVPMDPRENTRGGWPCLGTPRPGSITWALRLGRVVSGGDDDEQRVKLRPNMEDNISRAPIVACTRQRGAPLLTVLC